MKKLKAPQIARAHFRQVIMGFANTVAHPLDKFACYGRAHRFKPTSFDLISRFGQDSFILDFGGGDRHLNLPNYINLDVSKYPGMTTVVGDGHFLPFKDNSLDIVVCEAVIEHCKKPWIVANGLFRVLKKGGYIYVDAAFMVPVHTYPNHFFNMTKKGLEVLFERFKKLSSGVQPYQMPSYTVIYVLSSYLRCLFSTINNVSKEIEVFDRGAFTRRQTLSHSLLLATYKIFYKFLKYLDRRISPKKAEQMAAGVYFLGRKT